MDASTNTADALSATIEHCKAEYGSITPTIWWIDHVLLSDEPLNEEDDEVRAWVEDNYPAEIAIADDLDCESCVRSHRNWLAGCASALERTIEIAEHFQHCPEINGGAA